MMTTHRLARTITGLMLALAVAASSAPARAQATPEATASEQYTPVLQTVPSPPRWWDRRLVPGLPGCGTSDQPSPWTDDQRGGNP